MNIAVDVILASVIIACILTGRAKGFVAMIMKLAAFVLSGVGAFIFYSIPADMMYNSIFLPKLSEMIEDSIVSGSTGMSLAEMFGTKPGFFVEILNRYSTVAEVEGFYNSSQNVGVSDISSFMAMPVARAISNLLGFGIVFLTLLVILNLVGILLDKICRLPVIKGANKLLGTALGAVTGLFLAWVLAWVAGEALPYLVTAYPHVFNDRILDSSVVFRFLYNFNPLTLFNLK